MLKRTISVVLATFLMVTLFVGCGNTRTGEPLEKAATAEKTASTDAATTAGTANEASTAEEEVSLSSKEPNSDAMKGKTIGYILAGPDIYYQKGYEVFDALAMDAGAKEVIKLSSDYDPKIETNNVQDLIARKVDAILIVTVSSATGAQMAKLGNDANIPVFFTESLPNFDVGEPAGSVSGQWYESGYNEGKLAAGKYGKDARIVMIEGAYGSATPELHRLGFDIGFGEVVGKTEAEVFEENVVFNQTAQWATDKAQTVMQDALAKTGGEFDLIYVHNEAMKDGVLKALQPTGKTYPIYTINGKETTIPQIEDGTIEATSSIPPTSEAEMAFQQMCCHFAGVSYPKFLKNVNVLVTKDNIDTAQILPWMDSEKYLQYILEGKTNIDITKMPETGPTDPDWKEIAYQNGKKS